MVTVSFCLANISGIVTDTGVTPISGAVVQIPGLGQAASGKDGKFILGITSTIPTPSKSKVIYATVNKGVLFVNIPCRSEVEISTYNLKGQEISTVHKIFDAGKQSIALPVKSKEILLCKVKFRNQEFTIKSNSIGGSTVYTQTSPDKTQHGLSKTAVSNILTATKAGYLDYAETETTLDTTGLRVKMIICADSVKDIDGNTYHAVRIGTQIWTVENFRSRKFNNGTIIPIVIDTKAWAIAAAPAYCYYNNTSNPDSIKKFGALYNFFSTQDGVLAPKGWHVPKIEEFIKLERYLDATRRDFPGDSIGRNIAAKTDWIHHSGNGLVGNNLRDNNKTGFSLLPGGYRFTDNDNYYNTHISYFNNSLWEIGVLWTSTPWMNGGLSVQVQSASTGTFTDIDNGTASTWGASIRLVKDTL